MNLATYGVLLVFLLKAGLALAQPDPLASQLLSQSLQFYNREFRHAASGQYLDATSLRESAPQETNSSVAATGMGLAALALGDAAGVFPDAAAQAELTLRTLLDPAYSRRHPHSGWFRHWFNAKDGSDNGGSRGDGYSTIDTAILAAGAVLAANYFSAHGAANADQLRALSDELLETVRWESAVADGLGGRLYLNYGLEDGRPRGVTAKFNEYILVSCMGRLAESRQNRPGAMTVFWNRHYASAAGLPKKTYNLGGEAVPLLTDQPFGYLSSFAVQFAYYLCGPVNSSAEYIGYFRNAARADRDWFSRQTPRCPHCWGSGAGEAPGSRYAANAIGRNPDLVISPHIVAGFLAEFPEAWPSLAAQYRAGDALYRKNGTEILWRYSLRQPATRLMRVQAIDFSSMFLGLATLHPNIGKEFFKTYSAGR